MSFIQNLFTSRDNNANGASYVGQQDRIWWNPDTNAFYYSDGNTAGGVPVGSASGSGIPIGPINSIQINAGSGNFTGTSALTWVGTTLSVVGNTTATNFLSDNYLYANGASIFANTTITGNVSLGNLYINNQTLGGKNLNANITLLPEGDGWVTVPKLGLDGLTISNTGTAVQFDTVAGIDIQLEPGVGGNILTAGNIKPSGNNVAGIGDALNRYTGLWLGAGNINLIDQTLSQNQQIYADNGNLIIANSSGLSVGNFRFFGNTMALANAAANIEIGTSNATGYVNFNRAIAVVPTANVGGPKVFEVSRDGRTKIFAPASIPITDSAFQIIGTSNGNTQPRNFTGTMIQVTGQANTSTRITMDAFGTEGSQNAYGIVASRVARGTVDVPQPTQANDILFRLSSQAWTGANTYATGIARLSFNAAENFSNASTIGTIANIQLVPIGSNVIKTITGFSGNGINFPNAIAGGTGNLGITFQDGTFQNTAFSNTQVVTSATAATGISVSPTSTGNITITNLGVITVAGTTNQIFVGAGNATAAANGAVQLSLPQDIAPSSNPTFDTLTVTNLNILGNVSNVIPAVVGGPIIYVANTATAFPNINNSGLITGNAANGVYAGILYQTGGLYANTWDMTIGNSTGIFAGNLYADLANVQTQIHAGNAVAQLDYPYAVIQADMDQNTYTQIVFQNHNQGADASADFVAVANNGDDGNNYIDMGINSNVYNNNSYFVTKPNDGYLYVNGGNLVIGTQTAGKVINLFTGGTSNAQNFVRGTVSDTGLSMVGNVTANNFIGNTLATTGVISAGGNITGNNILSLNTVSAQGNVIAQNVNTGIVSATANVTGGNIRTAGSITATGNIVTAANLVTATTVINSGISTSGNITGANIITSGLILATGNINASNVVANLAIISSTLSILGNIQGGNLLTAGIISTSGNATFGNVQTTGRVSVTGNVDAGNLRTAGTVAAATVSTSGNITASFFIGNGSQLTGLNAFQTVIANGTNLLANSTAGVLTVTPGNNLVITANSATDTMTVAVSNNPTFSGNVSDANGLLRSLPINTQNTGYTLVSTDAGNVVNMTTGNVTVPAGVFTSPFGQAITIFNNQNASNAIVQAANVTIRLAGTAATGNRTLARYGLATLVCVSANTFVISGAGLT